MSTSNLRKEYPGTTAVEGFTAAFSGGKVYAIIGKNGSGKSTLIKMLSGAVAPTSGEIRIGGAEVRFESPREALERGIATVYQELSLIPALTVAENISISHLPKKPRWPHGIDWKHLERFAEEALSRLGVDLDPRTPVRELSVGQQQLVEIAKMMTFEPQVVVLDEPTSALASHETDMLFEVVRGLRRQNVVVIYITHRLQELPRIADIVRVMRDGEYVGEMPIADATPARIVEMMFGRIEHLERPVDVRVEDEVVLEVRSLTRRGAFSDVSFSLRRGEILGIAGMLGAGRTELVRSIFGADRADSGEVLVSGRPVTKRSPYSMKRHGMALTPENRKTEGLVQILSVRENLLMASTYQKTRRGIRNRVVEAEAVTSQIESLQIRVSDPDRPVSSLSGGNQQKVVVGNWLNTRPRIMIFDEPSRGIDVGAKQQIFQIIWDLSRQGISSILISTEIEELLEVCHRILVMRNGMLYEEADPATTSIDKLYQLCMGE
ncbi:sugar ABC transporter ATP-binding protein [Salinispira pacifica]